MNKKYLVLVLGLFFLSAGLFAQENDVSKIKVKLPSEVSILAVDGKETGKTKIVEIEPGVHTFTMMYKKIDILNEKSMKGLSSFDKTFDFKPDFNYDLKCSYVLLDEINSKEDNNIVTKTYSIEYICSLKVEGDSTTYLIKVKKPMWKPLQTEELPRKIDFYDSYPEDKNYQVLGNVKFETCYAAEKLNTIQKMM